jgi:hypothetical protein
MKGNPRLAATLAPLLLALVAFAPLVLASLPAGAHGYKLHGISIGHFYAPPPAEGGRDVAVYGPLLNGSDHAVTLEGATSPAAKTVRLRVAKDGEETHWPEAVELAPGRLLALAPWRVHIWVEGLDRSYAEGESFPLTLDFGTDGSIDIEVVVEDSTSH